MADLAASTAHAALWGRTNYGRAFTKFAEQHPDALGPKSSLLVLGDARSNYSDLVAAGARASSPAPPGTRGGSTPSTRGTGTPATPRPRAYGEIVPMVECRNLAQLGEFVHDIL